MGQNKFTSSVKFLNRLPQKVLNKDQAFSLLVQGKIPLMNGTSCYYSLFCTRMSGIWIIRLVHSRHVISTSQCDWSLCLSIIATLFDCSQKMRIAPSATLEFCWACDYVFQLYSPSAFETWRNRDITSNTFSSLSKTESFDTNDGPLARSLKHLDPLHLPGVPCSRQQWTNEYIAMPRWQVKNITCNTIYFIMINDDVFSYLQTFLDGKMLAY